MPIVYDKNQGIHHQVCQILRKGWVRSSHEMCHCRGHCWHWQEWLQWCQLKKKNKIWKVTKWIMDAQVSAFSRVFCLKEQPQQKEITADTGLRDTCFVCLFCFFKWWEWYSEKETLVILEETGTEGGSLTIFEKTVREMGYFIPCHQT